MNKLNRILVALLALQIVVLLVAYWPRTSIASGQPLFEGLDAEQIIELTVRDAAGQQVHLTKGPEGWGLPEADDFPVEEDKVSALLQQIVDMRADRLVTRTADSHKRLKVADEDFERLIEFGLKDGSRHKLYLGSSPRYQVLHVRADDQNEVYLTLGTTTSDVGATPATWINQTYFSVPQQEMVAITLENMNGRFEFEKDDAGTWTMANLPAGEKLLENNVSSLATRVSSLNMLRPLGREEKASYGLDAPNAQVIIITRDAEGNEATHIVRVGVSPEGESGFVVKSATSPYYVLMSEYTVQSLIEKTMQDFIELPPTPAPEPTTTPTPAP